MPNLIILSELSQSAEKELSRIRTVCWLAAILEHRPMLFLQAEMEIILGLADGPMTEAETVLVELHEEALDVVSQLIFQRGMPHLARA